MRMYEYKKILSFASIILLILTDQVSKYIIRTQGGFYICNKGVAFGLSFSFIFAIFLGLFMLFAAFNLKFRILNLKSILNRLQEHSCTMLHNLRARYDLAPAYNFKFQISNFSVFEIASVTLILSGGSSNLIDRVFYGCVIDFIDLKFWPVFNLADIYITIGAIVLMISYVFQSPVGRDHRPQK